MGYLKKPELWEYGFSAKDIKNLEIEHHDFLIQKEKDLDIKWPIILNMSGLFLWFFDETIGAIVVIISIILGIKKSMESSKPKMFPKQEEWDRYQNYKRACSNYNESVLRSKCEYWYNLNPTQFEEQVAKLYEQLGYKVKLTPKTGDGGVDVILERANNKIAVQCKHYQGKIPVSNVRELNGVITQFGSPYHKGILVSLNGGSKGAIEFCKQTNIDILDVNDLIKMQESLVSKI